MSLFAELQRRNVFRVAAAYLVVGWLLVEVSTTLLPLFGAPEWVSRVLVFVIVLGFVPAVIVSWVYELTPEGIKRESEVERDASITNVTAKRLNVITIATVVFGVLLVGWLRFGAEPEDVPRAVEEIVATEVDSSSVAVLPFVNMSGNEENEYFSDGLTETLLHMLAQLPELKVAARTSSFAFKGQDRDIREIADALDVAHVLEGSVQRAGDRVRITVQLIRASDGFHVWSENYDRTLDDIFGIQDEIAGRVGSALSASLLQKGAVRSIVGVGTSNIEAYDDYLHALASLATGSFSGLREAEQSLQAALAKDPEFVDAKIRLADVYWGQAATGMKSATGAYDDAKPLLQQALGERPDDIDARSLLIEIELSNVESVGVLERYAEYRAALEEMIEQAPYEPLPKLSLASILDFRDERKIELLQSVVELDPLNANAHYNLAAAARRQGKCDVTVASARRSLELLPGQPNAYGMMARCSLYTGDGVGWFEYFLQSMQLDPQDHEIPAHIAEVLFRLQMPELAREYLDRAKSIKPSAPYVRYIEFVAAHAEFGMQAGLPLAWQLVEEKSEDRKGSWYEPMLYVMMAADATGTQAATLQRLEKTYPGISDLSTRNISTRLRFIRLDSMVLWRSVYSDEELLEYLEAEIAILASKGLPDISHFELNMLQGNIDAAVEDARADFLQGAVPLDWPWRMYLQSPSLHALASHPQVVELAGLWSEQEQSLRNQLSDYFATRAKGE